VIAVTRRSARQLVDERIITECVLFSASLSVQKDALKLDVTFV
jgi:hypothetical protein